MAARLAVAALLAATAVLALDTIDNRFVVIPPPKHVELGKPVKRTLAASFSVDLSDGLASISPRLAAAARRYSATWKPHALRAASSNDLRSIRVELTSADESLGEATDYSYKLTLNEDSDVVRVTAATAYGAAYAFESFSQLLQEGALPYAAFSIDDAPLYNHRGLMLDTGRRFFPLSLVENILDTMAAVKLNVLHLHASDHCRLAVQTTTFPNVTAALTGVLGGYYTAGDVASMVAYAADRGIRVVPEFDVPGHSRGLLRLQDYGAQFCDPTDATCSQLYGDPGNKTLSVVQKLFAELSPLFPDAYWHIGADETTSNGVCTVPSTFTFERELLNWVESPAGLNKVAAGWEEVLFDAGAATNDTIVYSWSRHSPAEVIQQGRRCVASNASHFYLTQAGGTYPAGWENFYFNIADGVPAGSASLLLGGEMSQWTDTYCYTSQCGASNGATPIGAPLFPPETDAIFAQSIGGMLWPRGYVGASALWSYNSSTDSQDPAFVSAIWSLNDNIAAKGGVTCPSRCQCDQLSQCGQPLVPPAPISLNATLSVTACALPVPQGQSFVLQSNGQLLLNATTSDGLALCVASPNGSGNPSYPLSLQPCATGKAVVTWQHEPAAGDLRMVDTATHACLDLNEASGAVGEFECGSGSGDQQLNQAWVVDGGLVVSLLHGGCLTASS